MYIGIMIPRVLPFFFPRSKIRANLLKSYSQIKAEDASLAIGGIQIWGGTIDLNRRHSRLKTRESTYEIQPGLIPYKSSRKRNRGWRAIAGYLGQTELCWRLNTHCVAGSIHRVSHHNNCNHTASSLENAATSIFRKQVWHEVSLLELAKSSMSIWPNHNSYSLTPEANGTWDAKQGVSKYHTTGTQKQRMSKCR